MRELCVIYKHFPLVCHMYFYSLNNIFIRAKVFFILLESNLAIFSIVGHAFGFLFKNSSPNPDHEDFLLHFPVKVL